jgi:hypothetical protein
MNTRATILSLFEHHRESPGAFFDESHFLDYLLASPAGKRAVNNSFRGLRRFNAFIDAVQYEFGICFSLADREANYPLEKFAARVEALRASRAGSLRSLENQVRAGPGWQVLVLADFIFLVLAGYLRPSLLALSLLAMLAIVTNVWFAMFAWRAKAYLSRLRARIVTSEGGEHAV